jgi:hypothetical protein
MKDVRESVEWMVEHKDTAKRQWFSGGVNGKSVVDLRLVFHEKGGTVAGVRLYSRRTGAGAGVPDAQDTP